MKTTNKFPEKYVEFLRIKHDPALRQLNMMLDLFSKIPLEPISLLHAKVLCPMPGDFTPEYVVDTIRPDPHGGARHQVFRTEGVELNVPGLYLVQVTPYRKGAEFYAEFIYTMPLVEAQEDGPTFWLVQHAPINPITKLPLAPGCEPPDLRNLLAR